MSTPPLDDRDGHIWLDGRFVPWRDARLHVLTHGLHYGGGVFEGERVYDGHVFKLTEHSQRLHDSARELGFDIPFSVAELDGATLELVARQGIGDGYVRPVAWRGSEQISVAGAGTSVHVAIAAWEWPHVFSADAKNSGIRLGTSRWRRPAPDTAPVRAKAASLYNICTLARDAAAADGFDDALLLDYRGLVAEATGANIFLVTGKSCTPRPQTASSRASPGRPCWIWRGSWESASSNVMSAPRSSAGSTSASSRAPPTRCSPSGRSTRTSTGWAGRRPPCRRRTPSWFVRRTGRPLSAEW